MRKIISIALLGATFLTSAPVFAQSYYAREKLDLKGGPAGPEGPAPLNERVTSIQVINAYNTCVQIAEVEVTSGGKNVALAGNGGVATSSAPYDGAANASKTNDGVKPAGYPNIFHSRCNAGDYLKITFSQPVKVDDVQIWGRGDGYRDRDMFTYILYSGSEVVGGGQIDARGGSGGGAPSLYEPGPPAPPTPTATSTDEETFAYMTWVATDWKRMVAERGTNAAAVIAQSRVPPNSPHIRGITYENAGWYSRYGFSRPEPYIYFSLGETDWPHSAFCNKWAQIKPAWASNCDSYYGNHITFYLN